MGLRFVYIVLIVWIFSPIAIPADENEPSASRWGITTKTNLEDTRNTSSDEIGSDKNLGTQDTEVHPLKIKTATSAADNANTKMVPQNDTPAEAVDPIKIMPSQTPAPATNPWHDKKSSTKEKPSSTGTKKKMAPQTINWSSEKQREDCIKYIGDLRSLFLKTRHYSIQGASCDTAVSAAAFLKTMETCKAFCPEGLIENSGYTERITRNIRYLEKLGNDRCSGSLTQVPSTAKTP